MLLVHIILAIFIGIIAGTITGCIVGLHVNTVTLFLISISPVLLEITTPLPISLFIIAMAVTQSFCDALPAIYLSAPDPDQVLNVLPGHRMLLQGQGHEALTLTVIGSLSSLILATALIPTLLITTNYILPYLNTSVPYLLIAASLILILREKRKLWALIFFLSAGTLGITTLNLPIRNPLFPLLSGLFGTSGLLISLFEKSVIPKQNITTPIIKKSIALKAILISLFSGTLVSLLPGMGSAQAAILGSSLTKNLGNKGFLIMVGGINTVNFIMSFISLYLINKARNGAIVAISQILPEFTTKHLIIATATVLIAGSIATFIAIYLSKFFAKNIYKLNYNKLCISVIIFIILMTIALSGPLGLLLLLTSTALGILPPIKGTGRNHLMGCLILPVILFFIL